MLPVDPSDVPSVLLRFPKFLASVLRSTLPLITPLGAFRPTSTFTPGTPRFISDWDVEVPVVVAAEGFGLLASGACWAWARPARTRIEVAARAVRNVMVHPLRVGLRKLRRRFRAGAARSMAARRPPCRRQATSTYVSVRPWIDATPSDRIGPRAVCRQWPLQVDAWPIEAHVANAAGPRLRRKRRCDLQLLSQGIVDEGPAVTRHLRRRRLAGRLPPSSALPALSHIGPFVAAGAADEMNRPGIGAGSAGGL